ncbi:pyridoxal phosphate-dependent transferase [Schizophyllum fasciatum]
MAPSVDIHTTQPQPAATLKAAVAASEPKAKDAAPELNTEDALRAKFAHLEHHINRLSRQRAPSPLKDILQFMRLDGMISLAGGLPHPSLFPFDSLRVSSYDPATRMAEDPTDIAKIEICVDKQPGHSTDLSTALQYGPFNGIQPLMDWMRDFFEHAYRPGYPEWQMIMDCGSTDGWSKVANLLLEEGDTLLVEQHTYPSGQALWIPMGVTAVPIAIDRDGLVPEAMARTLDTWATERPNQRKPKVLYCVPVGQNPTGSTLTAARKQAIYDICVRHDIVIVEDDPYYFMQLPAYQPHAPSTPTPPSPSPTDFLTSLVPPFLHYDRDGRVLRLETVSKTLAPGFRLGFLLANPLFAERLARATEVATQAPSGWSQAVLCATLTAWRPDGYARWLAGLRDAYAARRDALCASLAAHFAVDWADASADGVAVYSRVDTARPRPLLFRFVPPAAGMFLWLQVDLRANPAFARLVAAGARAPEDAWAGSFWRRLVDARVLLTPGTYYKPWQGADVVDVPAARGHAFFRLAFSSTPREELDEGVRRMAEVFDAEWAEV